MTYPSLHAFYADDHRRRNSPERDVGLFWRGRGGATYRAAWVQATGEVYLLRHGRPDCQGGPVRLIGSYTSREVDEAFAGWRDVVGRPRSLDWLLARTAHSGLLSVRRTLSGPVSNIVLPPPMAAPTLARHPNVPGGTRRGNA